MVVKAKTSSKAYKSKKNVSYILHFISHILNSQLWLCCSANSLKQEVYFIEIRYCRIMFIKLPKSLPLFQGIILIHRKLWLDQLPNWRRYFCLRNPQWGSSINPRESEFDSGSFTTLDSTQNVAFSKFLRTLILCNFVWHIHRQQTKRGESEHSNDKFGFTYCASCSNIVEAFITSRFTTGPIRIAEY